MEYVDIVDENYNILYQTSKQEAHEKGLLHKCVIAEIINSKGEWALIIPPTHKQDSGQFVSPVGGHVSAGESDEDALKREVFEEAGLKNFNFKFIGKAIFDRKVLGRHENHYFALYEVYSDEKIILSDEGLSYERFIPAQIRTLYKTSPEKLGDAFIFVATKFYPEIIT